LVQRVLQLVDGGMGLKQAANEVSENFGGSKRELYQRALAEKK
jgi:16S rRNA C1402 (ribose-2'-O) methylase RsmI